MFYKTTKYDIIELLGRTRVQRKACDFYEKNICDNKYFVTFNADNGW